MWMDHRAQNQAQRINDTKHDVLNNVGGIISEEMEIPKLLWLKENLPSTWSSASKFFDLADFLTYISTGNDSRSMCTVTCKWNYQYDQKEGRGAWSEDFFQKVGLEDLSKDNFMRIGNRIVRVGERVGEGLTRKAAEELGLKENTFVSVGIIDAYSGAVGSLGGAEGNKERGRLEERIALISGTSSCLICFKKDPVLVKGVWGPYYGVAMNGMFAHEGGENAAGSLF